MIKLKVHFLCAGTLANRTPSITAHSNFIHHCCIVTFVVVVVVVCWGQFFGCPQNTSPQPDAPLSNKHIFILYFITDVSVIFIS
jgi:hypothetical protein